MRLRMLPVSMLVAATSLAVVAAWAAAQTPPAVSPQASSQAGAHSSTQPARVLDAWEQTLHTLAERLVTTSDGTAGALAESLPATVAVRRFDRMDAEDRLSLRQATSGAVVIAVGAYTSIPDTVAADLSQALADAEFVPEAIRAEFLVEGSHQTERANDTASQWVMSTLQPGVEQPVGVIVLWQEKAPESAEQQHRVGGGTMIFVLVKGHEFARNEFRVSAVVYGDVSHIIR
jgi:hypothetical protein